MIDNLGSTIFNFAYLGIIWTILLMALRKSPSEKSPEWRAAFFAFLLLAIGDVFHLTAHIVVFFRMQAEGVGIYEGPGVIALFGVGLVLTSITVQLFYLGMYYYWRIGEVRYLEASGQADPERDLLKKDFVVFASVIFRLVLIAYPQNQWGVTVEGVNFIRYLTNVPLFVIGILVIFLFLQRAMKETADTPLGESAETQLSGISKRDQKMLKSSALWIIVSFICYSLTLFFSWAIPLFGLFMIPKTIAYLVVLYLFYRDVLVQQNSK